METSIRFTVAKHQPLSENGGRVITLSHDFIAEKPCSSAAGLTHVDLAEPCCHIRCLSGSLTRSIWLVSTFGVAWSWIQAARESDAGVCWKSRLWVSWANGPFPVEPMDFDVSKE